jgi:pyruvate carboxylase subunit B
MIAQQVVYNVLGGERYATVSQELKDYLHGLYGRPPDPADKGLRRWVLGGDEAITVRAADLLDPQVDQARNELRRRGLPHEDVHALTHLMFPALTAVVFGPKADEPLIPPTGGTPGGEPDPEEMIAPAAGGSGNQALAPEPASASTLQATEFEVEVEGEIFRVRVTGAGGVGVVPVAAGAAPVGTPAAPPSRQGAVVAPMQGLVVKIPVAVGEQVNLGDVLIVLEAMKMHNDIVATQPGKVTRIHVKEGEVVKPDQPLLTIG